MPLCLPALKKLFTEYIQEMQGNRNKRVEKETVLNLESLLKGGKVIVSETDSTTKEKQENAKGQSLHIVPETDSTTNEEQENAEGQSTLKEGKAVIIPETDPRTNEEQENAEGQTKSVS